MGQRWRTGRQGLSLLQQKGIGFMNFMTALTSISSSGPLASRAYIPLFIVAFLAGNPDLCQTLHIPVIVPPEGMQWLVSGEFITIVGVLAVLEILADKNPEIQEFLVEFEAVSKPIVAALVTLMLMGGEVDVDLQNPAVQTAGIVGLAGVFAVINAGLTWMLTGLRRSVMGLLHDTDPDDDTGGRFFLSVAEDVWATVGILLCIILPVVAVILALLLLAAALLWKSTMKWLEDSRRGECPHCGHAALSMAVSCPSCKNALTPADPLGWSVFGGVEGWTNATQELHQLRLISKRRCPCCAEALKPREMLKQGCSTCGFVPDGETADRWFTGYHSQLMKRGWGLLLPLTLVALIPAVGWAVAIVTIKLALVSPFGAFVGRGTKFVARWGLRLFTVVMLIPASIPLVSLLAVPAILLVHLWVYGSLARRAVRLAPTRQQAVVAA